MKRRLPLSPTLAIGGWEGTQEEGISTTKQAIAIKQVWSLASQAKLPAIQLLNSF
ncbi:MAG: hypothetical protein WCA35_32095 [Kovacikia sp.]